MSLNAKRLTSVILFACFTGAAARAQESAARHDDNPVMTDADLSRADVAERKPVLVLQAGDEITARSLVGKEIADKSFRLDENGDVNFPLVGRVHLGGLSVSEAERVVTERLKKFYVDPDLELSVAGIHSEPFSVLGSVGAPGIYQMKTQMHLLDALSQAGGLRADAGPSVILTRGASEGAIPTSGARTDMTGASVATIDLKSLMSAANPAENVLIEPHDVISVPAAQIVYVVGNVKHAGGFTLNGRENLSVLQALSLAEGLDPRASPGHARILRRDTQPEQQIPVDLKKILAGKAEDVTLRPNDILFVPSSTQKVIATRSIEAMIQVGTGLIIWR